MRINLCVIGGGSSYTPELFADLAAFGEQVDVERVTLVDPDDVKLAFIGGVCERLVSESGLHLQLRSTTRLEDGLAGADFVILQIRVGGLAARVRDETLPMRFDMVGNETTGAGGFVCALRTVPAALEIAQAIERVAPQACLLNLSNPGGIVTEALLKHSRVRTLGFCNIPINTATALAEVLGVEVSRVQLDSFGLNHLSWTRAARVDGIDALGPLIREARSRDSILYQRGLVDDLIDPDWLQALGMLPGWYLRYFYYPEQVLEADRREGQSRGEADMLAERRLREIYTSSGFGREAQVVLEQKGGAQYYWPVLQAIASIAHDRGDVIVADVQNAGAVADLPDAVCVEVPARIGRQSAIALPQGRLPSSVRGLVQAVKAYEELTVEAAVSGDRTTALAALVANPLVGSPARARPFLDQALENERALLPRFWG